MFKRNLWQDCCKDDGIQMNISQRFLVFQRKKAELNICYKKTQFGQTELTFSQGKPNLGELY